MPATSPPPPAEAPAGEAAREVVRHAFHRVLMREPDEAGLQSYATELEAGRLDEAALLNALIDSDEFGRRALMRPAAALEVARGCARAGVLDDGDIEAAAEALRQGAALDDVLRAHPRVRVARGGADDAEALVAAAFQAVLLRDPEPAAVDGYAGALRAGMNPVDLVGELLKSEEFTQTIVRRPAVAERLVESAVAALDGAEPDAAAVTRLVEALESGALDLGGVLKALAAGNGFVRTVIPPEIALLAEQLIVRNMNGRGAAVAAPSAARPLPVTPGRMRAILHTLAAMSEPTPA